MCNYIDQPRNSFGGCTNNERDLLIINEIQSQYICRINSTVNNVIDNLGVKRICNILLQRKLVKNSYTESNYLYVNKNKLKCKT